MSKQLLYAACVANNPKAVQELLEEITNIKDVEALLHTLISLEHTGIATLFLKKGADINVRDKDGKTLLQKATAEGSLKGVAFLLAENADTNVVDKWGKTLLHLAAALGHTNIAALFLEKGIATKIVTNSGQTPLHEAALCNSVGVTRLLLENGFDVNIPGEDGKTPLHYAAAGSSIDVATLLLAKGASISAVSNNGTTPLHEAAWSGNVEMASLLLNGGANLYLLNKHDRSPLAEATSNSHHDVANTVSSHSKALHTFIVSRVIPFIQDLSSQYFLSALSPEEYHFLYTQEANIRHLLKGTPEYSRVEETGFKTAEERKAKNIEVIDQTIARYETPVSMLDNALSMALSPKYRQVFIDGILEGKGINVTSLHEVVIEGEKQQILLTRFMTLREQYEELKTTLLPREYKNEDGSKRVIEGPRAEMVCYKTLVAFRAFVNDIEAAEKSRASETSPKIDDAKQKQQFVEPTEPFERIHKAALILDRMQAEQSFANRCLEERKAKLKSGAPDAREKASSTSEESRQLSFSELIAAKAATFAQHNSRG